jgi:hypothetical protein
MLRLSTVIAISPGMVRRPPTTLTQISNTMTAPITDPMMPDG